MAARRRLCGSGICSEHSMAPWLPDRDDHLTDKTWRVNTHVFFYHDPSDAAMAAASMWRSLQNSQRHGHPDQTNSIAHPTVHRA
jgi:hypothetical protein